MKLKLDPTFKKRYAARIEGFDLQVGVLGSKPRRQGEEMQGGEPQTRSYAGGPVTKLSGQRDDKTNAQILIDNMKRLNLNLLADPFKRKNEPLRKFVNSFLKMATDKGLSLKRIENLLQALVRNPILKKEYGQNKASTADAKGFDRHLMDTGQMFRSIEARAKRVRK